MAAAETELQALVVRLEADLSSFKSEMLKGQKILVDSSQEMGRAIDTFSSGSKQKLLDFGTIANTALGVFTGTHLIDGLELIKKAFDTVFEGENIRAVSNQFEVLARNAKVSGEALRDGLMAAANGLVDDTDLLTQANKSLIAMGSTARDLPAVMEIARKATAAFGGTVSQNFEAMSTAIANGNARQLKNLGIVIDQDQAYKKFAEKIGTTAEHLNEAGKQQAMMNAVLEKGKTAFAGVNDSVLQNHSSWQQLLVTMGQMGEVATLAFEKVAGPKVHTVLEGLKAMAVDAKRALTASFGEGSEQSAAQVEILREKIMSVKGALIDIEQNQMKTGFVSAEDKVNVQLLNASLKDYEGQLKALGPVTEAHKEGQREIAANNKVAEDSYVNLKSIQQQYAEQGKKLADSLMENSPEKAQKQGLEDLKLMQEDHLVSLTDYYGLQNTMLQQQLTDEQALLAAAHEKKLIDELTYQSSLMSLNLQFASAQRVLEAEQKKASQKQTEERLQYTSKFFGDMSSLMKTKSRELFEIGKAAAVAQAIVDGYAAVQKTLASVPYPFSIPLAAAAGIAAAVNVSNILGADMKLAQGGVVPGITPVGDQVPVMANSGEMFLNTQQQSKLFDIINSGGGGGQVAGLLSQLNQRVDQLAAALMQPIIVSVDGQTIFEAMRGQVRAGRVLA